MVQAVSWAQLERRDVTRIRHALRDAEARDFELYKRSLGLRELAARKGDRPDPDEDYTTPLGNFTRSDAGSPLGHNAPGGSPLRFDGESHREAWMAIVRDDPCSYCGRRRLGGVGGTLDHIDPKRGVINFGDEPPRMVRGIGGLHSWLNYTAACENCNRGKGRRSLLFALMARRRTS